MGLSSKRRWVRGRIGVAVALAAALVACAADDPQALTNGRAGDGTRKNIPLPEPPPLRKDDGVELGTTSSPPASTAPVSAAGQALAADCVTEINRYRAMVGAAPLAGWSEAEGCTADASRADAASKSAHGSFGSCTELGQNECPGWGGWNGDPKVVLRSCLEMMWAEGPGGGHYENMKRSSFKKVSCAAFAAPNGDVTAIQNFR